MDSKEHEDSFREADRRYAELERQREAGTIDDRQFDAQRRGLMLQDDEGLWWIRSRETGEWLYHDGDAWVRGTPPGYREEAAPEPSTSAPPAQPPTPAAAGTEKRRKTPLWIPVVGFGAIALLALVVIVWVLMPYLLGALTPSGQDEPASGGVALDAMFVQRATSENISANSTYLDNPLTNGNPNAVLIVTQNWNPGGDGNTYNDHPVGVWYDEGAGKWAVFNQDREAMPEGAAFNVAVVREPPR